MAHESRRTGAVRSLLALNAVLAGAATLAVSVSDVLAQPPDAVSSEPSSPPVEVRWRGSSYRIESDPETGAPVLVLTGPAAVSTPLDARAAPPADEAGSNPALPASPRTRPPLSREQLVGAGAVTGLAAAVGLCAFVFVRWRRRRPFVRAVQILHDDELDRFDEAERLLLESLTRGLSKLDVADARFALAYLRIRSTRHEDAVSPLADLRQSGGMDADDAYLDLWLHFHREEYERVEEIYAEGASELVNLLDARQMVGLALLERARRLWKGKDLDGALDVFGRLGRLGVLEKHIPAHAHDHDITLGIQSLQQGDVEGAKKRFRTAADRADAQGGNDIRGRIGALLCEWKADRSPRLAAPLAEVVERMREEQAAGRRLAQTRCSHCDEKYRVPADYVGKSIRCDSRQCRGEFQVALFDAQGDPLENLRNGAEDALDAPADAPTGEPRGAVDELRVDSDQPLEGDVLLDERDRLAVNTMFWYAMVRLAGWRELPARKGLSADERDQTIGWLRAPQALDPDFPDPQLVEGLLRYYFPRDDKEREEGFEILDRLSETTVALAALADLCSRERRHQQSPRDSLNRLFVIVTDYLGNAEVSERHRAKLRERVKGLSQFKDAGSSQVSLAGTADPAAAAADRARMIREKVSRIISQNVGNGDFDPNEIDALVGALTKQSDEFQENASRLQDAEVGLLSATSWILFREETQPPPPSKDA